MERIERRNAGMSRKLTKKEHASIARKLLFNIYGENIDTAATIINAEANVLNDEKGGEETLAEALANARDFIQEIINGLVYQKQKGNGKRKEEKHYPRGC